MKKYINGQYIDLTAEEQKMVADFAAKIDVENTAQILQYGAGTQKKVITNTINTLPVDDNTALRMADFYPEWLADAEYALGNKVQYAGRLWRCRQSHSAQTGWEPENTASLWEQINETHTGTADDPIPYEGGMALSAGLYYVQDYVIYLCTRDTGNPVYHTLGQLIGAYVEQL